MQLDAVWQELLNRRRSIGTILPLRSHTGSPYWYVTTDKMISASEKIIEALYENDYDPYTSPPLVMNLGETFLLLMWKAAPRPCNRPWNFYRVKCFQGISKNS